MGSCPKKTRASKPSMWTLRRCATTTITKQILRQARRCAKLKRHTMQMRGCQRLLAKGLVHVWRAMHQRRQRNLYMATVEINGSHASLRPEKINKTANLVNNIVTQCRSNSQPNICPSGHTRYLI